jgi:hypothetical protein
MKDDTGKWIKPEKLAELLLALPAGSRIYPNGVGDLSIYDEADVDNIGIGWIDIMNESILFFDEEDEQ